ncbi:MAG: HAD-IIIA family hydrolase [Cyclobacteriaceae bacterium]
MINTKNIKFLILDVDGTLTDAGIYILEDGTQFKKFNARDGMGMKEAMKAGVEVGIISHSQVREMVDKRAHMLGLHYCYVGEESKVTICDRWMKKLNLKKEEVAYIGDDINDLEIMQYVGLSACPGDAVEDIKKVSSIILTKNGGEGCVREFIDEYLLK